MEWLIESHSKLELYPETLYLTQFIVDKYLSKVPIPKKTLQLVVISSLMVACKYEEIYSPETKDFV